MKALHKALMGLAATLLQSDNPNDREMAGWINKCVAQERKREMPRKRTQYARLANHGKAGMFVIESERLNDGDATKG